MSNDRLGTQVTLSIIRREEKGRFMVQRLYSFTNRFPDDPGNVKKLIILQTHYHFIVLGQYLHQNNHYTMVN